MVLTVAVCFAAFCCWQYFAENYPPVQSVLSRVDPEEADQWRQAEETVEFDSLFHRRQVTNDIDSDSAAELRLLDEQGTVVLETTVEPGQSASLKSLERDRPYTVEVRGGALPAAAVLLTGTNVNWGGSVISVRAPSFAFFALQPPFARLAPVPIIRARDE